MLSKITSFTTGEIESTLIDVEVDIAYGLPVFNIVGLPETAVRESRERVKAAIKNSGYKFPLDRITVNLAPADKKKEGTGFDLPVAVGILSASELVPSDTARTYAMVGELSLGGRLKPVNGILSASVCAKQSGMKGIIVPFENKAEASLVNTIDVIPAKTFAQVIDFLSGTLEIESNQAEISSVLESYKDSDDSDFADVSGQFAAKRALEIAAAGGHNILMSGPPGSGKTMLAGCMSSILPDLTLEESLDTTRIYSAAGMLELERPLIVKRPFRAPHHTVTRAGLAGGGQKPVPGEMTLAHNGVLFLDELPEFKRSVLEVLRQPMEEGRVVLARAGNSICYPADFMLMAAMNPCPCGNLGNPRQECPCTQYQIQQYRSRLSGPLLDRIDLYVDVPAVKYTDLQSTLRSESSAEVRKRVVAARVIQDYRFKDQSLSCNARMTSRQVRGYCRLDTAGESLLQRAVDALGLSARGAFRVLKIARTIADLTGATTIEKNHVAEAIQYRNLDRCSF